MNDTDLRPHYTTAVSSITAEDCAELIALALKEDAPAGDPGSEAIFESTAEGQGHIIARGNGILCGLGLLPILFELDQKRAAGRVHFTSGYSDGQKIRKGDRVVHLFGNLRVLLRLERIILNFLQYLSGISSKVAEAVERAGPDIVILDTRKTLPGFRRLAKYAVYCGGGSNHRIHLSEMAMIKDNHIAAAGGLSQAVKAVRQAYPYLPLEVEVDSLTQLEEALRLDVSPILLDNMSRNEIFLAKEMVQNYCSKSKSQKQPFLEVSGNWTPERLAELKGLGEIGVSMGALTHSSRFLDMSMEISSIGIVPAQRQNKTNEH